MDRLKEVAVPCWLLTKVVRLAEEQASVEAGFGGKDAIVALEDVIVVYEAMEAWDDAERVRQVWMKAKGRIR